MATTSPTVIDGLFLGGTWKQVEADQLRDVVSPTTEEVVARVPDPTAADADQAIALARRAFDEGPWPRLSMSERADVVARFLDQVEARAADFAAAFTAEVGATVPYREANNMFARDIGRDFVELARNVQLVEERQIGADKATLLKEPVGVTLAILAWNGPMPLVSMKAVPALLAGCTVIIKPSPESALTAQVLGEALDATGFPEGVVTVLAADRQVSEQLVRNPGVDRITFTGSTAAGRQIAALAADRVARVTLELGGKSPAIIAEDADLDAVLPTLVPGGLFFSGQMCIALTRVLVPRARHDEIVDGLTSTLAAMRIGDPDDPATDMGPVATRAQLEKVERYVEIGKQDGATLAHGGRRAPGFDRGLFYEPTLFANADNDMRIAREEVFGPIVSVIPYDGIDEAVQIANDTPYGLAGSVYTSDPELGRDVARRVRSGTFYVNGAGCSFRLPFGGYKQSGLGREGGPEGLDSFFELKTLYEA